MLVFLKCNQTKEVVLVFRGWETPRDPRSEKGAIRLAAGMIWQGYTYEELMQLGSGTHELELPRQDAPRGQVGKNSPPTKRSLRNHAGGDNSTRRE